MNSNRLLQYFNGYVDIVVEGYYIERFINICTNKQIFLWNLKRDDAITLHASVEAKYFKELRTIVKKTKCKIKIEKKKGFPFTAKKYKKRKFFIGLLLFVILVIVILSNFIWNIDVVIEGNTNTGVDSNLEENISENTTQNTITTNDISKDELLSIAAEEGLAIGKFKGSIDTKDVIDKIRLERDDIAWVGIDIKGTNATIKIVEADKKPDIVNEDDYCNIVADKDAMITKVTARNGTPVVKEGDVVKKGDPLIAGWLEGKYTGKQFVHSQGEVQAKVWYSNVEKVDLKEVKKVETGNTENKYSVKINNFKINLPKSIPKFEKYDTIETNKKLKLSSNFYLPFEIITYTYKEYKEETIIHSIEEAKQIGIDRSAKKLEDELKDKKILDKQVKVKSEQGYIEVEVVYEVKENIGIEEKIVF